MRARGVLACSRPDAGRPPATTLLKTPQQSTNNRRPSTSSSSPRRATASRACSRRRSATRRCWATCCLSRRASPSRVRWTVCCALCAALCVLPAGHPACCCVRWCAARSLQNNGRRSLHPQRLCSPAHCALTKQFNSITITNTITEGLQPGYRVVINDGPQGCESPLLPVVPLPALAVPALLLHAPLVPAFWRRELLVRRAPAHPLPTMPPSPHSQTT